MLNQKDIDALMQEIQSAGEAKIYYVAHMIEPREGVLDEYIYKSVSKFKVMELVITDIWNAYFEYMKFMENPKNYNTEKTISYYDHLYKHIELFVVPNEKPIESANNRVYYSRIPSIIYGHRRQLVDESSKVIKEISDPSPIKVVYTNALEYGEYDSSKVAEAFENGLLDWKYQELSPAVESDGVEYNYLTSDWYILRMNNFPRIELPLINVKQNSAFFMDLNNALDYIDQLEA